MVAKKKSVQTSEASEKKKAGASVDIAEALSTKTSFDKFHIWIVGDTPLITHAWSHKARVEMLQKQVKAVKGAGKEARDPERDFVDSLYDLGDGTYGFPVTGVKNCFLSAAHKDKGIPQTVVMRALWLDAQIYRVRPALAGAVCDMPLVRIYGSKPEKREDMVRIGKGLNKTASLAYRAQFAVWAMHVTGEYDNSVLTPDMLAFLIRASGHSCGLGEWRNEKKGVFGSFHLARIDEQRAWDKFASGKGPMPVPTHYAVAAE